MNNLDEIVLKFEKDVLKLINRENLTKIINFLYMEHCEFIEEILENYLDIFTFDYNDFILKYHKLDKKYNGLFLFKASQDMNLLEEFYLV